MLRIDPQTLNFDLPEECIAQAPLRERDQARLLVLDRTSGAIQHRVFSELPELLRAGDRLVLNKTRVRRAKVLGRKKTGGRVEVLFIEPTADSQVWKALVRPLMKPGTVFVLAGRVEAGLEGQTETGECLVRCKTDAMGELLERSGIIPLPPYIKREANDPRAPDDEQDYQTVYASRLGSLAAPTAGLHFSEALLQRIKDKGVNVVEILLHVGWGTFKPVSGNLDQHRMLPETYEVDASVYGDLLAAKRAGRRIIAVGTTSTRTLESLSQDAATAQLNGQTSLFIKPGFQFQWISGLVTNFHVPRSTPVALTAAFGGLDPLQRAYEEAIREKYRFYSYGDAMLIL